MGHGLGRTSAVLSLAVAASVPLTAHAQQAAQAPTQVQEVVVNGILPSVDNSYRVPAVEVGPLGDKLLLDTPYSISVVPVQLAENQQLESVRELFRYIPSVQGENIRPQSRGLQAGVVQNTRIDGLNIAATTDYAIEQFEQVEVLNGLAGALYGPASPAGTFNYVFKRPTVDPLNAVTLAYASQNSLIEHADLSRRFGPDDMFGARLNLLNQAGENYVDGSGLKRRLVSLALDGHVLPGTVVQLDFSTYRYIDTGFPGTFSLAQGVPFPTTPPDPTKVGYGLPWAGDNNETHIFAGRVFQDLAPNWKLTGGLLYMTNDRASTAPTDTITSTTGAYTATTVNTTFALDRVLSNNAALNGKVTLAGLVNNLFLGTTGFTWQRYTPFQTGAITLGQATLANPVAFAEPVLPNFQNRFRAQATNQQSFNFGDTLELGSQVSVMAAASQSWISASNISKTGAVTSQYSADGLSPTASLIYKPRANMTAYVTYADSLQQGDNAPAGTTNAGEALAPYRSKQWEVGYKIDISRVNLALALYQIERPYAFTQPDKTFALGGEQRNRGLELTANGRVTPNLNVFAGLSLLDPKLLDTGSAATSDKDILGLSKVTLDVLLEYRVPVLPQLTLSTNVNYASRRAGNYTNTDFVDGYTVVDLNARYQMHVAGRPVALRIAADNVGDERYWANIAPVGQNGYTGTDSGTGTLGAPRTVRVSIEVGF
ncbi:TonB-dependent siderophore receptor [Caulobacter sp. S45]|uniref:TonB-dependent receptor n=1 Tax=Caulobacter sp. S45 TaxID=1641861 RepID=UPI00131C6714|nr:TonB-dependent siderophore receptor [Caulobacter sp. S45]